MKQQLDPKAVWLFFFSSFLNWFILYIAIIILVILESLGEMSTFISISANWLWLIIPAMLAVNYLYAKLSYHFYRYELTADGFRKEQGIIWKSYITIPYNRIQNVDIYRGVIARLLGLSDLQIQTAGAGAQNYQYGSWGHNAEGRLPGISCELAEKLRDELIRRTKDGRSPGL